MPLAELVARANAVRRARCGAAVHTCTIMSAKSGRCAEDCKFCAQAARHATGVETYALKSVPEILSAARRAHAIGSAHFGIVTSGNRLTAAEIARVAAAIAAITRTLPITVCASLGALAAADLRRLKQAGLTRYHHNIETSRAFYPRIVSTHSFDDRIATIRAARRAGLEVCSGGIIGLGESWDDRIAMAGTLRDLKVDAVPINVLVPIKHTPLATVPPLPCADVIRTIAIFRLLLPGTVIKLAAGRETILKDFQAMAFMAGANGMIVGGYLTVQGRSVAEDQRFISELQQLLTG